MCQRLLYNLVHLKIICSSQADQALSEFSSFYHTSFRERKTSFEFFQKERDSLDDFYVKETDISNYKNLSSVFKLVLVFSHGQVAVEKGGLVGEISIISRRLIIDHMNSQSFATVISDHKESVEISEMFSTKIPRILKRKRFIMKTECTVCSVSHHAWRLRK